MLEFGSAAAEPGEVDTGWLAAGEDRAGREFGLPVAAVNGAEDGPTLYLQAASDGDELNGVGVVRETVRRIEPRELSGDVLVVGVLNVPGFLEARHENPVDDTKLNRVFPGDPDGTSSERLADLVYTEAVERADLGLDLHQGSTSRMIHEVRVRCGTGHELHEECLRLARAFGTEYVLDRRGPEGQLARVAPDDGVPLVDPELGGSVGWDPSSVERGVRGVFNVMREYDMLEGEPRLPANQYRARGFESLYSDSGGLLDLEADLYDEVEEGERLYDVTDVFGDVKSSKDADRDCVVWRTRRLPMVASGEYVMSVAYDVEEM
ncbi:MAG: succinylglutamate desuccinylase/aspartoacylase family protein [Halobacteriales archaeon]